MVSFFLHLKLQVLVFEVVPELALLEIGGDFPAVPNFSGKLDNQR